MGSFTRLLSYDELRNRIPGTVDLNNFADITVEDRAAHERMFGTVLRGDTLLSIPTCLCGGLKGTHLLDTPEVTCDSCGNSVVDPSSGNIQHTAWLKQPIGVAPIINICVMYALANFFADKNKHFCVIRYIVDPTYKTKEISKALQIDLDITKEIIAKVNGGKRSYNGFIENFDFYIEELFTKLADKTFEADELQILIQRAKENKTLFSTCLPMPSRSILIQERTGEDADQARIYMDETLAAMYDTIKSLTGIDHPSNNFSVRQKEIRTARAILDLGDNLVSFFDKFFGSKPGWFRRNIAGTRACFTGRGVIISETDEHAYDEIVPPWGMFIVKYSLHIFNKLIRRGYSYREMTSILQAMIVPNLENPKHMEWYKLINTIIDELFAESKEGRLPWFFCRNPTLPIGSTQLLYVSRVDRDPKIVVVRLAITNVNKFNADFDGDAMQSMALMSNKIAWLIRRLHPKYSLLDSPQPLQISDAGKIPATVALTAATWFDDVRRKVQEVSLIDINNDPEFWNSLTEN